VHKGDFTNAHDLTHPSLSHSSFPDELVLLARSLTSDGETYNANATGNQPPVPGIIRDVAHILRKIIVTRQEDYATTLAEDQALLQGPTIGERQRMAIQVRLGEKMILKEALDELERLNISSTPSLDHSIDIVSTKRRAEQDGMPQSRKRRGV